MNLLRKLLLRLKKSIIKAIKRKKIFIIYKITIINILKKRRLYFFYSKNLF